MGKSELRESIGLAAVFLGLVFVGLEMRQNTQMMQAQIRNAVTENTMEYLGWMATSEGVSDALGAMRNEGIVGLSPQQRSHMGAYVGGQLRAFENEHYQNKAGLFTDAEFSARRDYWRRQLTGAVTREAFWSNWESLRHTFAPDFRAEIDAIILEVQPTQ